MKKANIVATENEA